jgi:tetratricopeptide (TPR) repeat protein
MSGDIVTDEAQSRWRFAEETFANHEQRGWSEDACAESRARFEDARAAQGGGLVEADYMIALVHARCGDAVEAKRGFERILAAHPEMCEARTGIGSLDEEEGDEVRALAAYREAVVRQPTCPAAYVSVARYEARMNDLDAAFAGLHRALEHRPSYIPALHELTLLHVRRARADGELEAAERLLEQLRRLGPEDVYTLNTAGLIDLERGNLASAREHFRAAVGRDGSLYVTQLNLGQVALRMGNYQEAREAFARAAVIEPRAYAPIVGLGAALRGLGAMEEAERQYERALTLAPERSELHVRLARLLEPHLAAGSQNPVEHLEAFRRAHPWYERRIVEYAAGEVQVGRGRPHDAVRVFEGYLREHDALVAPFEVLNAHLHIARALHELGRTQDAAAERAIIAARWDEGIVGRIIASESLPEADKAWAVRAVVDAVAEVTFVEAEAAHAKFRALEVPALPSERTMAGVLEWGQRTLVPFLEEKQRALIAAETKYNEVAALRAELRPGVVIGATRWQIASAARVGMMYRDLVDILERLPVPDEIERDPDLRAVFRGTFREPIARLQKTASERFLFCLRSASAHRAYGEWSSTCASELRLSGDDEAAAVARNHRASGISISSSARPESIDLLGAAAPR